MAGVNNQQLEFCLASRQLFAQPRHGNTTLLRVRWIAVDLCEIQLAFLITKSVSAEIQQGVVVRPELP